MAEAVDSHSSTMHSSLVASIDRLTQKGLFGRVKDTISARLAERPSLLFGTGAPLQPIMEFPLAGSSDDATLQIHRDIYSRRSDVGVIVMAHSPWGSRLAALDVEMPAIFDEQIRQLGTAVPRWGTPAGFHQLLKGGNAFVHSDGVICLGTSPDRAVFNLELLEKCAKSFVLADLSGQKVGHIPKWVQWIASGRLRKDERKATTAFAQGKYPELTTGY